MLLSNSETISLEGNGKEIGIPGGGWYACHIALQLAKHGYKVTIFEKNADIFSQLSGNFGVRLHAGPHYPRSEETRKSCRRGFEEFHETYPELIVPHDFSIYGLGNLDSNGLPPKVNVDTFEAVCHESPSCQKIDADEWGFKNLSTAMNLDEPSIAVGERLREYFKAKLNEAGVIVKCNYEVKALEREGDKTAVTNGVEKSYFDKVINATSFQALLPEKTPFNLDVVYQTCLILLYEDLEATENHRSVTMMDGWFPCVMGYEDKLDANKKTNRDYVLYHSKYTIMGSFKTVEEARNQLTHITPEFVESKIKPNCEYDIRKFWPAFKVHPQLPPETDDGLPVRFKYLGYKADVLAKIKTEKEFRSAVTFEQDGIIHLIPGKINCIFDAHREIVKLLNNDNILVNDDGCRYVQGGVLVTAMGEITQKPLTSERNTCELQTYEELQSDEPTIKKTKGHLFWSKQKATDPNTIPPVKPSPL